MMIAQQAPMLTDLVSHRLSTRARAHAYGCRHFSRTRVGTLQMWIGPSDCAEWNGMTGNTVASPYAQGASGWPGYEKRNGNGSGGVEIMK